MKRFNTLLFVILIFAFDRAGAAPPPDTRVIASVVEITQREWRQGEGFAAVFLIHQPTPLAGAKLTVTFGSKSRKDIRTQHPVGSLFTLSLSETTLEFLKRAQSDSANIEATIDAGVPPEMIEDLAFIPLVKSTELKGTPVPFSLPQ